MTDGHSTVLAGKRVLVTGGTGSLGKVLVRRLLAGEMGMPAKVTVFSRDEAKQHQMRVDYQHKAAVTDDVIYKDHQRRLDFRIGDVADYFSIAAALVGADVVFNAAAMKQVPTCEYFPFEAVRTNVIGAENIVRAIVTMNLSVSTVVGISTDKACKPVNVMGMTKSLQERVFIQANMRCPATRFVCVRYGNVLASRGSVIPLFHEQIRSGGPVTVTTQDMTRFLLSIDEAVDTVFAAIANAKAGEIYVPRAPAARVINVARALVADRQVPIVITGIRPGEKTHEIMVSDEEAYRTVERGRWYAILPMLPELGGDIVGPGILTGEYSSGSDVLSDSQTHDLLRRHKLLIEDAGPEREEMLR
jgi:FlaA1/EpsC-like NDP-sugar epimerase